MRSVFPIADRTQEISPLSETSIWETLSGSVVTCVCGSAMTAHTRSGEACIVRDAEAVTMP
jgi:hypothetical protein